MEYNKDKNNVQNEIFLSSISFDISLKESYLLVNQYLHPIQLRLKKMLIKSLIKHIKRIIYIPCSTL